MSSDETGLLRCRIEFLQMIEIEEIVDSQSHANGTSSFEVKWKNSWMFQEDLESLFDKAAPMVQQFILENCPSQKRHENSVVEDREICSVHKNSSQTSSRLPAVDSESGINIQVYIKQETIDYDDLEDNEDTIFMCDICSSTFQSHKYLSSHKLRCALERKNISDIVPQNVDSGGCCLRTSDTQSSTSSSELTDDHSNSNNRPRVVPVDCTPNVVPTQCIPSVISSQCRVCSLEFKSERLLNEHMNLHIKYSPGGDALSNPNNILDSELWNGIRCRQCFLLFNSQEEFEVHTKSHTLEKDVIYECGNCEMTFADKEYLARHMVRCKNQANLSFRCDICQRGFTTKGSLDLHIDAVHLKKKEFGCSLCGKLFSRKHILKVHLDTHYGKREYACSTCGKTFLQKGNLNRHERIHEAKNFGYKCRYCGQAFTQNKHLQKHLSSQHDELNLKSEI